MKAPVTISTAAEERIAALLDGKPASAGLRLGTNTKGCAGMGYEMSIEEEAPAGSEIVESGKARLFIPVTSLLYLLGTHIDLEKDGFSERFIFQNPNVTDACGCGESFCV